VLRELAAASTFDRALPILEKTPYAGIASDAAESATARGFAGFERFSEMAILQRLKRAAQHEGLGIALLMHYAWLKYNEVMNLRMIARGLDIHLAPSRIREELVYV
jgi:vacuolar-type H+-ATPase subunit C/Vma6